MFTKLSIAVTYTCYIEKWKVFTFINKRKYFYERHKRDAYPNWETPLILLKGSTKFINFDFMQVQVDIAFDQLIKMVKRLPSGQLRQLKSEIEKESKSEKSIDLETLLLNGPVATKKQLETIANNTKAINQWRTK